MGELGISDKLMVASKTVPKAQLIFGGCVQLLEQLAPLSAGEWTGLHSSFELSVGGVDVA